MTYTRLPVAILAAAALAFGGALTAPMAAKTAQAQESGSYSNEKLRSFAQAAIKLGKIRSDYQAEMGSLETDEERRQLQQQTNQRMAQAVQQTDGISIEEYNEIATASRSDEQLAKKVNEMIKAQAQ